MIKLKNYFCKLKYYFSDLQRPASLNIERLIEQQREQRYLQADLNSHQASIDAVGELAKDFIRGSKNKSDTKQIENKLKEVQTRFVKLMDKSQNRVENLDEIHRDLEEFLNQCALFDNWFSNTIDTLESKDLNKLNVNDYQDKIEQLLGKCEEYRTNYEDLIKKGKMLMSRKDTSDSTFVRDKVKVIETQWKELCSLLEEKKRLNKTRNEKLTTYESLRKQVTEWLIRFESNVEALDNVSVDLDRIKKQMDELKPMLKDYKDYENNIHKINELGIAYENVLREKTFSLVKNKDIITPKKRGNFFLLLRAKKSIWRSED